MCRKEEYVARHATENLLLRMQIMYGFRKLIVYIIDPKMHRTTRT